MVLPDDAKDLLLKAHIDGASRLLGLAIEPAWRSGVLDHLRAIERAAQVVLAYALDDHIEAAPVFEP